MKTNIHSTIKIKSDWLMELEELIPEYEYRITQVETLIPTVINPYFLSTWGDFAWLRRMIPRADVRCFVTTEKHLKANGITEHLGMYDLTDTDPSLDFYIGLPARLDKRAKANGFKSNFAWMYCHEWCHGKEQGSGSPDRVHTMEELGKLKNLVLIHRAEAELERRRTLIAILKRLFSSIFK